MAMVGACFRGALLGWWGPIPDNPCETVVLRLRQAANPSTQAKLMRCRIAH